MAAFSEDLWQHAFTEVKNQFNIENLQPEQIEGIKAFFKTDSHVCVSLPTCFGKSLIYQSLPRLVCINVLAVQALL